MKQYRSRSIMGQWMTYANRAQQARCAALGFWPGPIDGIWGRRSQQALVDASASQRAKGLPFQHDSGVTRVHIHWTAGAYTPNSTDRAAYHMLIDGDGNLHRIADPWTRRAHTLNANGGAVGIAMCCMAGAVERPFNPGSHPMLARQLSALSRAVASLCVAYDIPVSRWSTLTHAEVQPTLGIKQRNKIDIMWLPGMNQMSDPIVIGDRIRGMIAQHIG